MGFHERQTHKTVFIIIRDTETGEYILSYMITTFISTITDFKNDTGLPFPGDNWGLTKTLLKNPEDHPSITVRPLKPYQ